ncbi:MAG: hypothetical protein ACK5HL_02385 [Bacilli bacterium]
MHNINNFLKQNGIVPRKYTILKNSYIITTLDNKTYVIKKKKVDSNLLFDYLYSRGFDFFPKIIASNDNFELFEYIEAVAIPNEQKSIDLINIVSLLHLKTTYMKRVEKDFFKKIYEELYEKLNTLFNYYIDLITLVESEVYMSPASYHLARNISKLFSCLNFCLITLDQWYELVKDKQKVRLVRAHNNLEVDHILNNKLISFDKMKDEIPIYELLNFYKKDHKKLDFQTLYEIYYKKYPLYKDEAYLLSVLISIPDKIVFTKDNFNDCNLISEMFEYIYLTEELATKTIKKENTEIYKD